MNNQTKRPMATPIISKESAVMTAKQINPTEHLKDVEQIAKRVNYSATMKQPAGVSFRATNEDRVGSVLSKEEIRAAEVRRKNNEKLNDMQAKVITDFEKTIVSTGHDKDGNWYGKLKSGGAISIDNNTGEISMSNASPKDIASGLLSAALKKGWTSVEVTTASEETQKLIQKTFSKFGIEVEFLDPLADLNHKSGSTPKTENSQKISADPEDGPSI